MGGDADVVLNETHLSARHVAFLDLDLFYFELERFKAERGWYNLNLTRYGIEALLADQSWYRLQIPADELSFDSFEKVRLWDEIAGSLLKKYTERYYTFRKREWELPHLEYRDLEGDDPNLLCVKESPDNGYYELLQEHRPLDLHGPRRQSLDLYQYLERQHQHRRLCLCFGMQEATTHPAPTPTPRPK